MHVRYGEVRRALCTRSPRPSCKTCANHCYAPEEAAWQRACTMCIRDRRQISLSRNESALDLFNACSQWKNPTPTRAAFRNVGPDALREPSGPQEGGECGKSGGAIGPDARKPAFGKQARFAARKTDCRERYSAGLEAAPASVTVQGMYQTEGFVPSSGSN